MGNRLLARLAVLAILAALVFYSFSQPDWEKQFRATLAALQKTRSCRISITSKDPKGDTYQVLEEGNCRGDYHSQHQHYSPDGTLVPMEDIEIWSVGETHVMRQHTNVGEIGVGFGAPPCDQRHLLEPLGMLNYEMILAHGNGVRKGKKTVDGQKCRVWAIQMPEGGGWGDLYDMCVAEDNLPLEIVFRGNARVIHASQWNQRIDVPQPPERSSGASE